MFRAQCQSCYTNFPFIQAFNHDLAQGWSGWMYSINYSNSCKQIIKTHFFMIIHRYELKGWNAWMDIIKEKADNDRMMVAAIRQLQQCGLRQYWLQWLYNYQVNEETLHTTHAVGARYVELNCHDCTLASYQPFCPAHTNVKTKGC